MTSIAGEWALLALAAPAAAQSFPVQGPPALPQGTTREQMWYAPTAEDWKKPCLIQWQRTFEDALAVSKETGKAVLVCANMDGEIASEHYAGVRYRQPEIAALYEPYVCVIASVYRHNPRDYDEQGRRIVCPRFGTVTCGEHIAIEPGLYDQFMDGRRIAPRHIGVETQNVREGKKEIYDVFYAFDTDTIFKNLKKGIDDRQGITVKLLRGDRTILERVESADSLDKAAVETAYQTGSRAERREILATAHAAGERASSDLLRLALFDLDGELNRLARQALAKSSSESAVELINDALRVSMPRVERDALIEALERIGEASPRAKMLAVVHRSFNKRSTTLNERAWWKSFDAPAAPTGESDASALDAKLAYQVKATLNQPTDGAARAALAEALLDHAVKTRMARQNFRVEVQDALRAAREAESLGVKGWSVDATIALGSHYLDEREEAYRRAEAAVRALPDEPTWRQAVDVLVIFAEGRQRQITDAISQSRPWPPEWLTDLRAAHHILRVHPHGTEFHAANYYDFLRQLGAPQARRALDDALIRFPDSWILHDRLRGCVLAEKGAAGLEAEYESRLALKEGNPSLEWYAGYASLVAAEFHRCAGDAVKAVSAYERGIAHFELAAQSSPVSRETADHYIALALAGRAKLAYEGGDDAAAVADLLSSFAHKPEAAASLDGLNLSPVDTAKLVRVRLTERKNEELLKRLQAGLDALDPSMLLLPAYEAEVPPEGRRESQPGSRSASRPGNWRTRR